MKRVLIAFALVLGVGATGASTATADTNVGVQAANITQSAFAYAPALQDGGGFFSTNVNVSHANAVNFASIEQSLFQING